MSSTDFKHSLRRLAAFRWYTATFWIMLSILAVSGVVIFHVHSTLSDIERTLPLKILEQRRDIAVLEQQLAELHSLVEHTDPDSPSFHAILPKIDILDQQLRRLRATYKLDNLMGAASVHAVVAPMLTDVRSWLTQGVHGYQLSDQRLLSLARTRVSDANAQVQSLVDHADRQAFAILEEETNKITGFRLQMMAVFVALLIAAVALVYYISRRNAAQRALVEERQRAQLALDAADLYDWEWNVPEDTLRWGRDPKRLLGPADADGNYPDFRDLVHDEDREGFLQAGRTALMADDQYRSEFRIRGADGGTRWLEAQGRRLTGKNGEPERIIGVSQDITERKRAEQEIHRYAYFDSLTELPNRQHLVKQLDAAVEKAVRLDQKGALLFMDLDHFKTINDSLGHAIGDRLLKGIADRIRDVVRSTDLVGRLGGDEFTVLLPNLSRSWDESRAIARGISEKIQRKLASPYKVDGHELHVSVSIGISMFPLEDCPVEEMSEELLKNADTAMYSAKTAGRHTIRFFAASMRQAADRRLALQRVIRQALVGDHFRLEFQPQVDGNGRVSGVEALLRLESSEMPDLDTHEIIDVAEESGLILPLGDWVLGQACRHLRNWADHGVVVDGLSVNVSPRQFHQKDFVERVVGILSKTGADPSRLEMEITEGAVMINVESAIDKMDALKQAGIRFAIDDFGTGYSSLAYLKRLPLDRIKIDQSFTRDVVSDPSDVTIVETIVSMARTLGLKVIAEGVETAEALEALKDRFCTDFQGHYFSRPLDEKALLKLLRQGSLVPEANRRAAEGSRRSAG